LWCTGGGCRVAPDGGAAGGVGDEHAVAEELGDEASIAGLGAAGAGAGELEQRLVELGCLDVVIAGELALLGDLVDGVIPDLCLIGLGLLGNHGEGAALLDVALGADVHAVVAAHAVERGDGHRELVAGALRDLEVGHTHG
jgi:hypothetical protein